MTASVLLLFPFLQCNWSAWHTLHETSILIHWHFTMGKHLSVWVEESYWEGGEKEGFKSLKSFHCHIHDFEMMVYIWGSFGKLLPWYFGNLPPPSPAMYQNLIPAHDHSKNIQVTSYPFSGKKKSVFSSDHVTRKETQQAHSGMKEATTQKSQRLCIGTHGSFTADWNRAQHLLRQQRPPGLQMHIP